MARQRTCGSRPPSSTCWCAAPGGCMVWCARRVSHQLGWTGRGRRTGVVPSLRPRASNGGGAAAFQELRPGSQWDAQVQLGLPPRLVSAHECLSEPGARDPATPAPILHPHSQGAQGRLYIGPRRARGHSLCGLVPLSELRTSSDGGGESSQQAVYIVARNFELGVLFSSTAARRLVASWSHVPAAGVEALPIPYQLAPCPYLQPDGRWLPGPAHEPFMHDRTQLHHFWSIPWRKPPERSEVVADGSAMTETDFVARAAPAKLPREASRLSPSASFSLADCEDGADDAMAVAKPAAPEADKTPSSAMGVPRRARAAPPTGSKVQMLECVPPSQLPSIRCSGRVAGHGGGAGAGRGSDADSDSGGCNGSGSDGEDSRLSERSRRGVAGGAADPPRPTASASFSLADCEDDVNVSSIVTRSTLPGISTGTSGGGSGTWSVAATPSISTAAPRGGAHTTRGAQTRAPLYTSRRAAPKRPRASGNVLRGQEDHLPAKSARRGAATPPVQGLGGPISACAAKAAAGAGMPSIALPGTGVAD